VGVTATSHRLGPVRVDLLDEGRFRLDGGAIFGVVPRVMWSALAPPDERNRVDLALRPLLVRTPEATVLVDVGIGPERRDPRFADRFGVAAGPGIEAGLAALGLGPGDVDRVVLTHMHFDHGGGLVRPGPDGEPVLRFPSARVVVQRGELEDAGSDCRLCRASYVAEDYALVREAGRLEVVDGDVDLVPGVRLRVTGGHTRAHQLVEVTGGGETLVFWGDLIPTRAHLRPHYVMALDLYPVQAYEAKAALLEEAIAGGWVQVFYHDPELPIGRVRREGRGYVVTPL